MHRRHGRTLYTVAFTILAFTIGGLNAQASPYIPIAPLPGVNSDLNAFYTNGFFYPFGGTLDVGGVPFTLTTDPGGSGDTLVIQDPNFFGAHDGSLNVFDIPVGVAGATTVYTLMNSAFGICGSDIASLEFFGSGGAYFVGSLIEGTNIRDHFNGGFCNDIAPGTPSAAFGGDVRLDLQTWVLPAAFASQTLDSIRFSTHGSIEGEAFLAAATVQAVPEPTSLLLLGSGLFGYVCRRKWMA
jgi:hypothetical protein